MKMSNSKFLVGNTVTYVDFILFELCEVGQFLTDGRLCSENVILARYSQNFMMLPRITDYLANDADFRKRTFNNKIAKINNSPEVVPEVVKLADNEAKEQ